ncbi:DUF6163 family protein [Aureimonas sp. SA4125]|uniref:DUF6163 family protein n=1 Tax=Aureimonas sp. SA4125 TaxID=2826993 RepID=UPI001CC5965B|nr:DUF6163 family protein [Aureimonas sp. SA4125]
MLVWLLRLSAMVLFAIGIFYWVRLVGIYDGPLWRFDLMPIWWRVAATVLAVLAPVAGVGLWMVVSWGAVIWIIVALVEAVMHLGFPGLFGSPTPWMFFHLVGLSALAVLRLVAAWVRWRRLRRP